MMNSERLVLAAENMLEDIEVQQKLQSKIYDEKMSTSDGRRMENVDTYDVDGACRGLLLSPKEGYVEILDFVRKLHIT